MMKCKLSIVVFLLIASFLPASIMAQGKPRTSPDKAKYSIVGTMNYRNGERYLDNPVGKRIEFEYDETRPAMPTEKADLEVRFDFVKTDHPMTKMDFWRYDAEAGEWIYDSEVRQSDTVAVTKMQTNVMLVIDKSSSLKGDFPKVQEAAIEFVNQLYTASREKGVTFRVGVIAFSTIKFTETREITTLDAINYNEIVSFIRGLKMENGTALYYSLDKALEMLEKDTRNNILPNEYRESRIYAFTDGLDQASIDDARGLTTPTDYFEKRLRPMMKGPQRKLIMNMPRKIVRTTMVTVRGDDMTDKQEILFDERAEQICDNVRKLDDMTKLVKEFKLLAADLVNSNFILTCYIPEGASGLVGWTFRDDVPRERTPSKAWMGLGVELGKEFCYTKEDYEKGYDPELEPYVGMHLDAAWPITDKFSLGGSIKAGLSGGLCVGIGPLAKFDFENNNALLLGLGAQYQTNQYNSITPYVSLGWKFKSPWYVTLSINGNYGIGFCLGAGYSIRGGR